MDKKLFLLLLFVVSTLALFNDDSAVFKLTAKNFQSSVVDSDEFWLVEFYGNSRIIQPPGAATAKILPPNTRKPLKFWTGSCELEPSTWMNKEKPENLTMFRATPLSNFSEKTKASPLPSSQLKEPLINLWNIASSNSRVK
jgi:hypothetical protein